MSTTVNNVNVQFELKTNGRTEYYQYPKMSNLAWVLNTDGNYYLQFTYEDDYFVKIQLSSISNQPGWTNDSAGAEQAVKDVSSWIGTSFPSTSGLATEATLQQVLTAVDNMRDYEVRLVEDSTTPNKVTWLEVRYWDAQSGALGTPVYYLPGSTTAGSPVLPISYINDRTLLTQILAELQGTLDVNVTNAVISVSQSGAWTVTANQGTSPWVISGTVNVGNFPATQNVAVTSIVEVEVKNDTGNPLPVSGTVTVNQPVAVTDNGGSLTVDGSVNIGNFPTGTQACSSSISTTLCTTQADNLKNIDDATFIIADSIKAEDSVHVTGAKGSFILGVRNDLGTSMTSANGDYSPIAVDISGAVAIQDAGGSITVDGTVNVGSITGPVALPTGAATQSTLASVDTRLTPQSRTHNTIVATTGPTAIGSVPISLRGSVLNSGSAAGIWNGISLPAGVSIPWDTVGNRDTYAAIPYNATGTTFIIEYTT